MLPDQLDRPLFDRLAAISGEKLVSIYLPTHVKGADVKQDRIRLKNGLAQVDRLLDEVGWSPSRRSARLEPAHGLLEDEEFWQHQGPGLGVLIDEKGTLTTASLATEVVERTTISGVFHLRPAIPSLRSIDLPLLVLTKGSVRLYMASRHAVSAVDADLPESFEDVNWFVDREKQRQRHPDRAGTRRGRHGHEGGYREEDLERFLRAVAEALPEDDDTRPLIVLGDTNIVARFANLLGDETISPAQSGLDDVEDLAEIQEKAASVIARHESSLLQQTLEEALEHLGTGTAITEVDEGLAAAVSGRISTLVLDAGADPVWGDFDPATLEVTYLEHSRVDAVDLLDRLAIHSMGTGAEVVTTSAPIEDRPFVAMTRF